jgi:hypothetical protein
MVGGGGRVSDDADVNVRLVNQAERLFDRAGLVRGRPLRHHRDDAPLKAHVERLAQVRGRVPRGSADDGDGANVWRSHSFFNA